MTIIDLQKKNMKFITIFLLAFGTWQAKAQKKWDLRSIVDYAMINNIGVKQTEIQVKNAALTYQQGKLSQLPSANFNGNTSINSGNNQDPTTFSRVTQTFFTSGFQLQTSADIFNWFSKRNTNLANEWELKAATANVAKLQYDIALSAANVYLQILLAKEQQKIAELQIQQTQAQLNNTRKQVDVGVLPQINLSQLEAQLALDSSNYISAKGSVTQNILSLKSFMSIDAAEPFEVETPPVEAIPVEPIGDLQPEYVYLTALQNQPLQKFNEYKLNAAVKATAAAKGALYPTISAFGSLSTNYLAFQKRAFYNQVIGDFVPTPFTVNVGGQIYNIQQPTFTQGSIAGFAKPQAFFNQLDNNFRQAIGIGLSVPIFNGGILRTNYRRSKLNEESLQIQKVQDNLQLKQDIYTAYTAAIIALEKVNASKKGITTNETTYDFAQKRFNVGMLGTFDLITTQNNLLRARLEYALNQFDYVFKMKVLEYYKGAGLKL